MRVGEDERGRGGEKEKMRGGEWEKWRRRREVEKELILIFSIFEIFAAKSNVL